MTAKKNDSENAAAVPVRKHAEVAVKREAHPAVPGEKGVMTRPEAPLAAPGEKSVVVADDGAAGPENLNKG